MASRHYDFADINSRLLAEVHGVLKHLYPNGKREGREFVIGDVNGADGDSLSVNMRTGRFKDFADGEFRGDLVQLWAYRYHISNTKAAAECLRYLGVGDYQPLPVVKPTGNGNVAPKDGMSKTDDDGYKPINAESLRNNQRRLASNEAALAYLHGPKRGLEDGTIAHFGLGLSSLYTDKDGVARENALMAPLRSPETGGFLKRSGYVNIPDVTLNPKDKNSWMPKFARTYWADKETKQRFLFVCEGLKDVWKHWQELSKAGMMDQFMLISSTHGSVIPEEWKNQIFWQRWQAIYLGQDNDDTGNGLIPKLIPYIGCAARRIAVPNRLGKDGKPCKDWTDFWQNGGGTIDEFRTLLDDARVLGAELPGDEDGDPPVSTPLPARAGNFSYRPVDINGAYTGGHLYYTIQRYVVEKDTKGGFSEGLETVVIRSDRTIHSAYTPQVAPGKKPVLKLTDGTIIEKEPIPSKWASWEYESVCSYLKGRTKPRPLVAIVKDVLAKLKQCVWLPYEEDYAALALTVPATYVQTVFDSVPLLHLNGPAGSGKTQLGNALSKLCCNGSVVGQVSAAAAARHIDETRGLVVIDDIEAISSKTGKDALVNEFVQALKQGYNKSSATKIWTDVKAGMKNEKLNFFGIKVLSNTLGSDPILGSRMIRIQTLKMPDGMSSDFRDFSVDEQDTLRQIRNELHVWAFENVGKVDKVYHQVHANKTDRSAEIAAPLRVMAQMCGDGYLSANLEACLVRQHLQQQTFNDNPIETLKVAVRNLIKQGYETFTLAHIRLEMNLLRTRSGKTILLPSILL